MSRRGGFGGRGRNWNQNRHNSGSSNNWSHDGDNRFTRFQDAQDVEDFDRKPKNTKRHVSFKPSGVVGRGGMKNRNFQLAIKARLEDDEEMADFGFSKANHSKKNRRKGSPVPRKLPPSSAGWYMVTIPFGRKYEKDVLIRHILTAISPEIFIPNYWKYENEDAVFYVDDAKIAERLMQANWEIQMPDGFKLSIRVRPGVPQVQIDANVKERMKLVMAKRYNAATKALDLTKFHADPDLKDIFCALSRPSIMLAAIDIMEANIPDLEALNLNDNRIHLLDHFKCMAKKLPNLKILYLANNRIQTSIALLNLKTIPLIEIMLEGNPFKNRFKNDALYKSDIRRKFPKLRKLDGIELEPEIGFDVAEQTTLPPAKASFLCDAAGADVVRQFIEQYFIIYDSANRQPLLDAYHEQAMLSLSVASNSYQGARLNNYFDWSRNILRMAGDKSRHIRYGRLPVVSFLSELPKTQHDPQSFSVDLTLFTPKLINFVVTGVFRELSKKEQYGNGNPDSPKIMRSFQRVFMIVPMANGGFCIRNEMLFISNPTQAQSKMAFKPRPAEPIQPAPAVPQVAPAVPNVVTPPVVDESTKLQMIQALSTQSTMNFEWSKKCLEETLWDYNRAINVFTELHKQGKIPPDAFAK